MNKIKELFSMEPWKKAFSIFYSIVWVCFFVYLTFCVGYTIFAFGSAVVSDLPAMIILNTFNTGFVNMGLITIIIMGTFGMLSETIKEIGKMLVKLRNWKSEDDKSS